MLEQSQILLAQYLPRAVVSLAVDPGGQIVIERQGSRGMVVPPAIAEDGQCAAHERAIAGTAMAAAAVLVAALLGQVGRYVRANTDALMADLAPRTSEDNLGFVRLPGGWLGIALVGDQPALFNALLSDGDLQNQTPAASALTLQRCGIAALPARAPHRCEPVTLASQEQRLLTGGLGEPLSGATVLDAGRLVAGPWAASILASLGAQVVRPEVTDSASSPPHLDLVIENTRPVQWQRLSRRLGLPTTLARVGVRGFPTSSPCSQWKVLGNLAEGWVGLGQVCMDGPDGAVLATRNRPTLDRIAGTIAAAVAIDRLHDRRTDRANGPAPAEIPLISLAKLVLHGRQGGQGAR